MRARNRPKPRGIRWPVEAVGAHRDGVRGGQEAAVEVPGPPADLRVGRSLHQSQGEPEVPR